MTRSHAKNTHTQSILSPHERAQIRGETAAKRLGAESFKPFNHCYLCLSVLVDPVSCPKGHMYCRECALSNLISQKAGIEVQKREMAAWEAREENERAEARRKARERVLDSFERGLGLGMGLGSSSGSGPGSGLGSGSSSTGAVKANGTGTATTSDKVGARIGGRDLGASDIEAAAKEAEERALRVIEAEQVENRKSKLPSFWLPSLAPEAVNGKTPIRMQDVKLTTTCQYGGDSHPFTRKTLLPVHLHYPKDSKTPHCPSCARELSNSVQSYLLSSRSPATSAPINGKTEGIDDRPAKKAKKDKKEKEAPYVCGHVVCKTCADTIVKPAKRCCVCEAGIDVGEGKGGLIPVGKEGTGYAAAGGAEVKDSSAVLFRMM